MTYLLLTFWFFIALVLFIGGIMNNSGQSERRMERFGHETRRKTARKIENKINQTT